MPAPAQSPAPEDVLAAARGIAGRVHETPVLTSRQLDAELGCSVALKAENLQRIGAFKARGAMWALAALPPGSTVVAYSSGNHAQAIALAARELGHDAIIVMPHDAPASKRRATEELGTRVVGFDRAAESREQIAQDLADREGGVIIPPFDHPRIIAGQGTAALELFDAVGELDALFVPCGGGGLLAGSLLAARLRSPECVMIGVEPAAGDDAGRSLEAGRPLTIDVPDTIADGAQTRRIGDLTFAVMQEAAADGRLEMMSVLDSALVAEMVMLASRLKTVVEPTGCLGLAGLRAQAGRWAGRRTGAILSGGNVDLDVFARLVASPDAGRLGSGGTPTRTLKEKP